MKKPLIGITLDSVDPCQEADGKWYSDIMWYALRHRYADAIVEAGGVPIAIPYVHEEIKTYIQLIDGLVVSGGGCDVDPIYYGETQIHPSVLIRPQRCRFELNLTQEFLKTKKPFFGICGGMQVLNVACGGSLYQHLPDEWTSEIEHTQKQPRSFPQHPVKLKKHSLIEKLTQAQEIMVNSIHHQGIKTISPNLLDSAHAPDGLIEAIEDPLHPFCIGVQWHPEFHVTQADKDLLHAFVKAAQL